MTDLLLPDPIVCEDKFVLCVSMSFAGTDGAPRVVAICPYGSDLFKFQTPDNERVPTLSELQEIENLFRNFIMDYRAGQLQSEYCGTIYRSKGSSLMMPGYTRNRQRFCVRTYDERNYEIAGELTESEREEAITRFSGLMKELSADQHVQNIV